MSISCERCGQKWEGTSMPSHPCAEQSFTCKLCNVGFSLLEDLVNHRQLVHVPMKSVMSDAKRWEQLAEDLFDLAFLEDDDAIAQTCLIYATQAASVARAKRQSGK